MSSVDDVVRRSRVGGDELRDKSTSPRRSPEEREGGHLTPALSKGEGEQRPHSDPLQMEGGNGISPRPSPEGEGEGLPEDAFPASARVPGQAKSREIFLTVEEQLSLQPWYEEYLELRAQKLDWRKAAYVAWLATPKIGRVPATLAELANLLGVNDRTMRGWVQRQPELKELARQMQMAPLMAYRSDVIAALIASATVVLPAYAADRRLFFQLTGDLEEKSQQRLVGSTEEPPIIILPAKLAGEGPKDEQGQIGQGDDPAPTGTADELSSVDG